MFAGGEEDIMFDKKLRIWKSDPIFFKIDKKKKT